MYQPINQVRLRGFLTEPARLFVSRSGQPRIAFRMEVWIADKNLPPKNPAASCPRNSDTRAQSDWQTERSQVGQHQSIVSPPSTHE